jgi:hypothetical protein
MVAVSYVATAAKRWRLRGKLPPSGERWLRGSGGYGRAVATGERWRRGMVAVSYVAIRCQAVEVARKRSTVWRAVATGERWRRGMVAVSYVATAAKRWMLRGKLPPSGERWLRGSGGGSEEEVHRLASGGYGGAW